MGNGLRFSEGEYAAWLRQQQGLAKGIATMVPVEEGPEPSEATFLARVVSLAKKNGFMVYHTHDSRRSSPGFPDLVLCGGSGVVFAELKTTTGKLTREQAMWLEMLKHAGQECHIWRPGDWPTIEARLAQG